MSMERSLDWKSRHRRPSSRYDGGLMERLTNYESLSHTLARLTDEELAALVAKAAPLHAGIGGRSVLLMIDSTPIFL